MFYLARTVNGKVIEYREESDLSSCSILMFKTREDAEKRAEGLEKCQQFGFPIWSPVEWKSHCEEIMSRGETHPMFLS